MALRLAVQLFHSFSFKFILSTVTLTTLSTMASLACLAWFAVLEGLSYEQKCIYYLLQL